MKARETIEINLLGKDYEIDKNKLLYVLSALENKEITNCTKNQISELMTKYDLFDENFLKHINKL